jgi:hypothetical protein
MGDVVSLDDIGCWWDAVIEMSGASKTRFPDDETKCSISAWLFGSVGSKLILHRHEVGGSSGSLPNVL